MQAEAKPAFSEHSRQSAVEAHEDITTTPPTTSNDAAAGPEELNSAVNNNVETQSADAQKNTASTETERRPMSMEDYADSNSPVWNNLAYDDTASQQKAMKEAHDRMVTEGKVVEVPESTIQKTAESFPDLRGMKKADHTPILKQKMSEVKTSLRQFLSGLKGGNFEFEVNGNVLEAKLYDTGIKEVLEKITQDKANMLSQSDQIFKNAEYLYSLPDYDGDSNIYRWNYFYTPVKIGDSTVGVRIAVRDMVNPAESQIYNWGIKKAPTLDGGSPEQSSLSPDVSSVGGIDASLDGARPLPDTGSNPGGVSSDASSGNTGTVLNMEKIPRRLRPKRHSALMLPLTVYPPHSKMSTEDKLRIPEIRLSLHTSAMLLHRAAKSCRSCGKTHFGTTKRQRECRRKSVRIFHICPGLRSRAPQKPQAD